ncbi:MAG: HD domain-containing protein [Ruminococcus sp.]|nr:HD domain-containing protein [Ruminococcus sp.]
MIYTELTKKAMQIAYEAHQGQYDKGDVPYIFHPYHVAEQMTDETTTCTALLHDVIEDTEITLEHLEKEFPQEITEALKLLTRDGSMTYSEYIERLKHNPVARAVKLADLKHNSDMSRLDGNAVSEEKIESLKNRYLQAEQILTEYQG